MIIVNESVDISLINSRKVKRIYQGKLEFWENGKVIVPIYIDAKNEEGKPFFEKFLKINPVKYQRYWLKKSFSGEAVAPKAISTTQKVIAYVNDTPNTIAVVPEKYADKLMDAKRVEFVAFYENDVEQIAIVYIGEFVDNNQ